ncbi:hypothetical protein [Halocatena pleomorpha]
MVEGRASFYSNRQEIKIGYKQVKRFVAKTTSKGFVLRFFYLAFACLLYSTARAVDLATIDWQTDTDVEQVAACLTPLCDSRSPPRFSCLKHFVPGVALLISLEPRGRFL